MRWSTLISILTVSFLFSVTKPVQADQFTFFYSFSAILGLPTPVSANGVLTTTALDPNSNTYTVTNISGTRLFEGVTQNITGIIASGGYAGNDNLLSVADPFLDSNGLSFTVDGLGNTGSNVNVFYDALLGGYTENGDTIGVGTFTVNQVITSVPESSSTIFFGSMSLGFGWLFFAAWRRSHRLRALIFADCSR